MAAQFAIACAMAYAVLVGSREAYDYAMNSPRFEAKSLIFEPTAHIDDRRIRELMGLEAGAHILDVDVGQLHDRIAADPWVASVEVTRLLPDTLAVRVTEHDAVAAVLAEHFWLVDSKGHPFKRALPSEIVGMPVITGVTRAWMAERRGEAGEKIESALELMGSWNARARPKIGELHLEESGGASFYLARTGTRIRLGPDDHERAFVRFDGLWAALGERARDLAVVHLDQGPSVSGRARIIARFHASSADADSAQASAVHSDGDSSEGAQLADASLATVSNSEKVRGDRVSRRARRGQRRR